MVRRRSIEAVAKSIRFRHSNPGAGHVRRGRAGAQRCQHRLVHLGRGFHDVPHLRRRAANGRHPREVAAIAPVHRAAVHLHLVARLEDAVGSHAHAIGDTRPTVDLRVVVDAVGARLHQRLADGDLQRPLGRALVDAFQKGPSRVVADRHAAADDLHLCRALDLRDLKHQARRVHDLTARERRLQAQIHRSGQVVVADDADPRRAARQQLRQAALELVGDHDVLDPRARGGVVPEPVGHQDGVWLTAWDQQEVRRVVQAEVRLVAAEICHRTLGVPNGIRHQRVQPGLAHTGGNRVGATLEFALGEGQWVAHRGLRGSRAIASYALARRERRSGRATPSRALAPRPGARSARRRRGRTAAFAAAGGRRQAGRSALGPRRTNWESG